MKFYSEILDEFFDSEKECIEAEFDAKKKKDEQSKFEKEKIAARANLEKKIDDIVQETIAYFKKYESDTPWMADFAEKVLKPQEKVSKRPAATPITQDEFQKLLSSFLK